MLVLNHSFLQTSIASLTQMISTQGPSTSTAAAVPVVPDVYPVGDIDELPDEEPLLVRTCSSVNFKIADEHSQL